MHLIDKIFNFCYFNKDFVHRSKYVYFFKYLIDFNFLNFQLIFLLIRAWFLNFLILYCVFLFRCIQSNIFGFRDDLLRFTNTLSKIVVNPIIVRVKYPPTRLCTISYTIDRTIYLWKFNAFTSIEVTRYLTRYNCPIKYLSIWTFYDVLECNDPIGHFF